MPLTTNNGGIDWLFSFFKGPGIYHLQVQTDKYERRFSRNVNATNPCRHLIREVAVVQFRFHPFREISLKERQKKTRWVCIVRKAAQPPYTQLYGNR